MKVSTTTALATAIAFGASGVTAFTVPQAAFALRQNAHTPVRVAPLRAASDDEIQRMKELAAKLRDEAASLEAEQQEERNSAAERAFRKFDTNGDGEVSLDELKAALEKTFKMEVPDDRVQKLMKDFDSNGDGKLQPNEFVGIEQFRNRLEQIASEERRALLEEQRVAQKEAEMTEIIDAALNTINDRTPTGTDKIVSLLPYLFPLMDGLQYGKYLLGGAAEENPVVIVLAVLYTLYRSVPFGGFICFFGLSALGNNLSINRLTRFNIQQAIYLDIFLIIPGFFGAVLAATGLQVPILVEALGSSAIFLTMLAIIGYASVSSLFGVEPNKVPILSDAASNRMPPPADSLEFDYTTGMFQPKDDKEKKDE